jgi:hypothetical protein
VLTPVYWTEFEVTDPAGEEVETSRHVVLFFSENMEQAVLDLPGNHRARLLEIAR